MVITSGEMDEIEALRWRLPMPPRFLPYLEKHRIYDMFYELAVELVINRPKDHVQFLKHALTGASMAKDKPRVILLAPPFFGTEPLAKNLADAVGAPYVPVLERTYQPVKSQGCETSRRPGESLPRYVARVLRTEPLLSGGWVIAGFPRSGAEADILRREGVRPTHVLQLLPSATLGSTCLYSESCQFTPDEVTRYMEYMRRIRGLREAFQPVLKEVDIRGRSLEELGAACASVVRCMAHRGAPSLFRVALLGPTGSGSHTQARMLARRFNLVLVDAGVEEVRSRLGECSERLADARGKPLVANERVAIVQRRLMKPDCLHQGWVLVGCPRSVTEMRALDRMDTPPNRVLVLDAPAVECRRRLVLRRFNKFTSSEHHLDAGAVAQRDREALASHPDDCVTRVDRRLREYTTTLPALLSYLGDTALVLRVGGLPPDRVFEMTSAAVLRRPPPAPPRDPEAGLPAPPPPPQRHSATAKPAAAEALGAAMDAAMDAAGKRRKGSGASWRRSLEPPVAAVDAALDAALRSLSPSSSKLWGSQHEGATPTATADDAVEAAVEAVVEAAVEPTASASPTSSAQFSLSSPWRKHVSAPSVDATWLGRKLPPSQRAATETIEDAVLAAVSTSEEDA